MTAGEIRRQKELKRIQDRKRGYCECCEEKYEDLYKVKVKVMSWWEVGFACYITGNM